MEGVTVSICNDLKDVGILFQLMTSDEQPVPNSGYRADNLSAYQQTIEFWNARSKGYSIATRKEIDLESNVLRNMMRREMNLNKKLKVVDMGTGAGYAAITLARLGHDVTALDASERMLNEARQNAQVAKVDINFVLGDVTNPPLLKHEYDLVIAKSVVWNLIDPTAAYSSWIELLRPGGFIIVIDGNWYLDEFDEDFKKRRMYVDMKYGADNNLHARTNIDGVDLNIIRKLACNFPASRERRPAWDVGILMGLGVSDIRIQSLDNEPFSVLTRDGMMRIPMQFSLIARIPRDRASPYEEAMSPYAYTEEDLNAIRERLSTLDMNYASVLKALSDTNRLSIVSALMGGKMNVGQIATVIGQSTSLTSHNLKVLKECNIVISERYGKEVLYSLSNIYVVSAIVDLCTSLLCRQRFRERFHKDFPCLIQCHRDVWISYRH